MDHKILRTLLLVGAVVLGYGLVLRSDSPVEAIGMIILVALLLLSMENVKRKRDKLFETHTNLEAVDQMSKEDFVAYSSHLYKRLGYYISGIKTAEAKGADLVLSLKDKRYCVSCENEAEVITKAMLESLEASMKEYHCKRCMMITSRCMNEDATAYAQEKGIEVVDRERLADFMQKVLKPQEKQEPAKESSGSMA
ncbi:MAG: restriction endonuclease [Cellulosilyticaceae bacterium]